MNNDTPLEDPKVLVIDIGGSNVKALATGQEERVKFKSGTEMTPEKAIEGILAATEGWEYDVVSIGYPGIVSQGRPSVEPANLGTGWVDFDFVKAFGCPVKIVNDAAMQALGGYEGGRMLFLGFGTGLGSALVVDNTLVPMELAHLPYKKGRSFEDYVGRESLEKRGKKKWRKHVQKVIAKLKNALVAEQILLGGGNAELLETLPSGARLGDNSHAFEGGFRLWQKPYRETAPTGAVH